MALLDDIATALVSAGVGQMTSNGTDWFIYKGYLQEGPDRAICLYETPGPAPEELWAIDYPDFQVRVRGKLDDYQAVRAKMQSVFFALHDQNAAIGAGYVYCFCKESGVIPLGQDEKRRPNIANNYRVMKNRPSS